MDEPLMCCEAEGVPQPQPQPQPGTSFSHALRLHSRVGSFFYRLSLHAEVQQYVQGVVTYVLSRQWKDLFAIYALRLQPLPYCSNQIVERIPCSAPATIGIQALFVMSLLVGAAIVARIAAHYEGIWPRLRAVPAMAGMCVGWSFGDLSIQLLVQLGGGVASHFAWAIGETIVSATILAAASMAADSSKRITSEAGTKTASSSSSQVMSMLPVFYVLRNATWPLVSHALGVGVMVTWAYSFKTLLLIKLEVDPLHGMDDFGVEAELLYKRLLLLWGISSTAVSALFVTRLVRWRSAINALMTSSSTTAATIASTAVTPISGHFFFFDFARHRRRVSISGRTVAMRSATHALVLVEGALGWLVGSAWTDVIVSWTSLVQYPTIGVTFKDLGLAIALTVSGVVWLLFTGLGEQIEEEKKADRGHVELYFLTRAMAFFVGWSWISLCRDISTLLAYHDSATPVRNYVGQVAVAFALGPMLTVWLVRADVARREDLARRAEIAHCQSSMEIAEPHGGNVPKPVWQGEIAPNNDDSGARDDIENGNYVLADSD